MLREADGAEIALVRKIKGGRTDCDDRPPPAASQGDFSVTSPAVNILPG